MKLFGRSANRQNATISWWSPYWFHLPHTWRTWRLLLGFKLIARVSIVSLFVGAVIVIGVKIAMPQIQLPPLWRMLLVFPTFYAYVLLMLVVHALIPSRIGVHKDRIHVMTGQSHWVVKSEAIQATRIVIYELDRIRLRVYYDHKNKLRSRTFGVGRRVNLDTLAEALAVYPQVWDARSRYRR